MLLTAFRDSNFFGDDIFPLFVSVAYGIDTFSIHNVLSCLPKTTAPQVDRKILLKV